MKEFYLCIKGRVESDGKVTMGVFVNQDEVPTVSTASQLHDGMKFSELLPTVSNMVGERLLLE
jgi:hypothetical protein